MDVLGKVIIMEQFTWLDIMSFIELYLSLPNTLLPKLESRRNFTLPLTLTIVAHWKLRNDRVFRNINSNFKVVLLTQQKHSLNFKTEGNIGGFNENLLDDLATSFQFPKWTKSPMVKLNSIVMLHSSPTILQFPLQLETVMVMWQGYGVKYFKLEL